MIIEWRNRWKFRKRKFSEIFTYGFSIRLIHVWLFWTWGPCRQWDWPEHRWECGICIFGQCWFWDVWLEKER